MAFLPDPAGRSASVLLNREFTLAVLPHANPPLRATRAAPQQVVVAAGAVPAALPVVRSGRLHFTFWVEDADRLIAVSFGPGETALLSSLFAAEPLPGELVAAQECALEWLPKAALERLVEQRLELSVLLARFLAARLREVQDRERRFLARSVHARVGSALQRAAQATAEPGKLRMTHEELAAWAGISRPKASAVLKQLEREGRLRLHRGWIELL